MARCPACRGTASSARRVYGDIAATCVACLQKKAQGLFSMECGHMVCQACLRSLGQDAVEATLLPPTLAKASKALGRTMMPVSEGGAFKLLLLDINEAVVVMNTFKVPVEAYKHMQGEWTAVRIAPQGTAHGPTRPVHRTLFIAFSAVAPMTFEDFVFGGEWMAKHNAEEWPRVRAVTQSFDPEDRRKILTVSSQVHEDLVGPLLEYEDHRRVWEAQREAARRRAEAPAPVVEMDGKV